MIRLIVSSGVKTSIFRGKCLTLMWGNTFDFMTVMLHWRAAFEKCTRSRPAHHGAHLACE